MFCIPGLYTEVVTSKILYFISLYFVVISELVSLPGELHEMQSSRDASASSSKSEMDGKNEGDAEKHMNNAGGNTSNHVGKTHRSSHGHKKRKNKSRHR